MFATWQPFSFCRSLDSFVVLIVGIGKIDIVLVAFIAISKNTIEQPTLEERD